MNLLNGDCLELMKDVPDNSIDMVLTDPPYGTTACKWDTVIPFEPMWKELKRITKDNGAICLFGSEPFSSALRISNIENFRYDWVWDKKKAGNFRAVKTMPLVPYEVISVFYAKKYYPQMTTGKLRKKGGYYSENEIPTSSGTKQKLNNKYYPKSILEFSKANNKESGLHPTQKPVALLEYLIKTYTLENETVLDFTMGSGSTGVACKNLNRKFIGIEKDKSYFDIAKERIMSFIKDESSGNGK